MWDIPVVMFPPTVEQSAEFHAALYRYVNSPEFMSASTTFLPQGMEFMKCEPEDDDTQEIDPPVEVGDAAT